MAQTGDNGGQAWGWLAAIGIGLFALGRCTATPDASTLASTETATPTAQSTAATVTPRVLKCRSDPATSAPVIETLTRAASVAIVKQDGTWSQLSRIGGNCWVATAYLDRTAPAVADALTGNAVTSGSGTTSDTGSGGGIRTAAALGGAAVGTSAVYAVHRATAHRTRSTYHARSTRRSYRRSRSRPRRASAPTYFYGDSCPCSGSHICIGPRGGRYCITSGGNKRYGV